MLEIIPLVLGPASTNCYLVADPESGEAAVIDPAWDGQIILDESQKRGWKIGQIWITHAHFDHIGGSGELARGLEAAPVIALHPADRPLWNAQGGGPDFCISLSPSPAPTLELAHNLSLQLGHFRFQVRHAPGHTPGLCVFYCAQAGVLFSGDLIFHHSMGRTDLPGGDWDTLITSIRQQVNTLPAETRILPGHGQETTVGEEKRCNPFTRT
jgi:hydroxyacylglutathione hydrolase